MALSWTVDGIEQLKRRFSRFEEYMDDIRGAYPEFKRVFHEGEQTQFNTETGDGKWAPLSEPYGSWKAKNFPGASILIRQGTLREAMTGETPYKVWHESEQELAVEVKLDYALYHQRGTDSPMPAREVIWFTEDTKKAFTLELHRWINKVIKEEEAIR